MTLIGFLLSKIQCSLRRSYTDLFTYILKQYVYLSLPGMELYRFSRILDEKVGLYGFSESYSKKSVDMWFSRELF